MSACTLIASIARTQRRNQRLGRTCFWRAPLPRPHLLPLCRTHPLQKWCTGSNENAAKSVFKLGDGATVRMNIYSTKNGQKVDNDRCWTLDTSSTSNTVTSGTQLYMSKVRT